MISSLVSFKGSWLPISHPVAALLLHVRAETHDVYVQAVPVEEEKDEPAAESADEPAAEETNTETSEEAEAASAEETEEKAEEKKEDQHDESVERKRDAPESDPAESEESPKQKQKVEESAEIEPVAVKEVESADGEATAAEVAQQ